MKKDKPHRKKINPKQGKSKKGAGTLGCMPGLELIYSMPTTKYKVRFDADDPRKASKVFLYTVEEEKLDNPKIIPGVRKKPYYFSLVYYSHGSVNSVIRESYICSLLTEGIVDLGHKIIEFLKTRNEDFVVDIIKKYPEVIFDDGVITSVAVYLTSPATPKVTDLRELYFGGSFLSPIVEQIKAWRMLTDLGNPEEKKGARDYLKKAGLTCFIQKSPGRKKSLKPSRSYEYRNPFFTTPWYRDESEIEMAFRIGREYKKVNRYLAQVGMRGNLLKDLRNNLERKKKDLQPLDPKIHEHKISALKLSIVKCEKSIREEVKRRMRTLAKAVNKFSVELIDKEQKELVQQANSNIAKKFLSRKYNVSVGTIENILTFNSKLSSKTVLVSPELYKRLHPK
ncbi:hypothetical protein MYX76_04460 [Desulfobacterota bacterium AH_259_B03_O07]|nr:hypothetical protein [Desulfobacterota bacterium AH_259_B03_O07]